MELSINGIPESNAQAVRFPTNAGALEISARSPRILRIRLGTESEPGPLGSPVRLSYLEPEVAGEAQSVAAGSGGSPDGTRSRVAIRASSERAGTWLAGEIRFSLAGDPLRLSFFDQEERPLLSGGSILIEGSASADKSVTLSFPLPREHHFYGLGHFGGRLDRLGVSRALWNSHTAHGPGSDFGVPLLVSNKGYALFFDDPGDARLAIGRTDAGTRLTFVSSGSSIDLYLLWGGSPRGSLEAVGELLGRAPLPPRWALGYLQSTRHFESREELRNLGREIRRRRIPCDALIFLSTYWEARGWNRQVGCLDFEPSLFGEPGKLLAEIHEHHFEVITHEYPVVHPASPEFAEAEREGYLLSESYPDIRRSADRPPASYYEGQRYIDFSNPRARKWWWRGHRALCDLGVAGWWLDGGEGPAAQTRLAAGAGRDLHNSYDLSRMRAFAEGEAADRPDIRPFLLCRSGGAGMQRYGAWCWSGDIDNTFQTLEAQVTIGLGAAISGVPYWGTDIGGFFHPVAESGELYARWFQFGAFCPLFRSHGQIWREHLPWAHGEEIEAICRRYAELRYELLPYTYSLARQAHTTGLPLMRPLCLNYPDDPQVWDLGSEYLWGDDILVAPVTREGARHRALYLPAGSWYDFWSGERYPGGRGIEVDAPLDRLPLFVREGAILPTAAVVQHTGEHPPAEIVLLVYPPAGKGEPASRFDLYEDDGTTRRYERGAYALTVVSCANDGGAIRLEISPPRGEPSVIPARRSYLAKISAPRPSRVTDSEGRQLAELAPGRAAGGAVAARGSSEAPGGAPERPGWWHSNGVLHVRFPGASGSVSIS